MMSSRMLLLCWVDFYKMLFCVILMQALANCKLEVCKALGIPTEQFELSMGMSGDFEQAVIKY